MLRDRVLAMMCEGRCAEILLGPNDADTLLQYASRADVRGRRRDVPTALEPHPNVVPSDSLMTAFRTLGVVDAA